MIHEGCSTHPKPYQKCWQKARSRHKLPPDWPVGSAAPNAPDAAEEGSSFEAAAGPEGLSVSGIGPDVGRAGVTDEVALVEDLAVDAASDLLCVAHN